MPRDNSPARRRARYLAAVARQARLRAQRPDVYAPVQEVLRAGDTHPPATDRSEGP